MPLPPSAAPGTALQPHTVSSVYWLQVCPTRALIYMPGLLDYKRCELSDSNHQACVWSAARCLSLAQARQPAAQHPCADITCMSALSARSNAVPCAMRRNVSPETLPASTPTPGAVRRAAAAATRSARPAMYPPLDTMVPPGLLIRLPIARSAPTWDT